MEKHGLEIGLIIIGLLTLASFPLICSIPSEAKHKPINEITDAKMGQIVEDTAENTGEILEAAADEITDTIESVPIEEVTQKADIQDTVETDNTVLYSMPVSVYNGYGYANDIINGDYIEKRPSDPPAEKPSDSPIESFVEEPAESPVESPVANNTNPPADNGVQINGNEHTVTSLGGYANELGNMVADLGLGFSDNLNALGDYMEKQGATKGERGQLAMMNTIGATAGIDYDNVELYEFPENSDVFKTKKAVMNFQGQTADITFDAVNKPFALRYRKGVTDKNAVKIFESYKAGS